MKETKMFTCITSDANEIIISYKDNDTIIIRFNSEKIIIDTKQPIYDLLYTLLKYNIEYFKFENCFSEDDYFFYIIEFENMENVQKFKQRFERSYHAYKVAKKLLKSD